MTFSKTPLKCDMGFKIILLSVGNQASKDVTWMTAKKSLQIHWHGVVGSWNLPGNREKLLYKTSYGTCLRGISRNPPNPRNPRENPGDSTDLLCY